MISSGSAHDISETRDNLQALEQLCQYVRREAAQLQMPEAASHAQAAAERIRQRLAVLGIH